MPTSSADYRSQLPRFDGLQPVRQWLDAIEIPNCTVARFISKVIPAQCPFERDLKFLGRTWVHIPPLCKLNPLYDQFAGLRFRSLCYLVEQCDKNGACQV